MGRDNPGCNRHEAGGRERPARCAGRGSAHTKSGQNPRGGVVRGLGRPDPDVPSLRVSSFPFPFPCWKELP